MTSYCTLPTCPVLHHRCLLRTASFGLYERLWLFLFSDKDTEAQRRHPSREQRGVGTQVYQIAKSFHFPVSPGRAIPQRREQPGSSELPVLGMYKYRLGMLQEVARWL